MMKLILLCSILLLMACGPLEKKGKLSNSFLVTGQKADDISNILNSDTTFFSADDTKIVTNLIKNEGYNNTIEISFITNADTIKDQIERIGSLLSINERIYIDIYQGTAYIAWISEPNYDAQGKNLNHSYELYLKSIDLNTGKEYFNNKIFSTKCCIERLSMRYNPFTTSVLFSYNDFSRADSKYLMYDEIKLENNRPIKNEISPGEIISQDQSEKRFPNFLIDQHKVYLYHSSGDTWGFFAHTGKQQIGISEIDNNNLPVNYKIISDSCAISDRICLFDDTIYFQVRVTHKNKSDEMQIKKVALKDLHDFHD